MNGLDFVKQENKSNLIIFIHGFRGGKDTWIREDGTQSILDYLKNDTAITGQFDFAIFDYYSKVTDVFTKVKSIFGALVGAKIKMERNIPIADIAQLLQSEIRYKCTDYKNIVLIAHSMGGLVSKSYILEEIRQNKSLPIKLFISLAVPHRGTNLAVLGKAIVNSPQVADLEPLSKEINSMSDNWIQFSNKLPDTIYFQGKMDDIVPNVAAISIDAREKEIVYSGHTHTSIVTPESKNDVVVRAIIQKCLKITSENSHKKIDKPKSENEKQFLKIVQPEIDNGFRSLIPNPVVSAKDQLKYLASNGKIDDVCDKLIELKRGDSGSQNKVYLISARWNQLKNENNGGIITFDNADVKHNRIFKSLMDLIDELEW